METSNTQSRYADTVELNLADLLTTEAQGVYDAEQLAAIVAWLKADGN